MRKMIQMQMHNIWIKCKCKYAAFESNANAFESNANANALLFWVAYFVVRSEW